MMKRGRKRAQNNLLLVQIDACNILVLREVPSPRDILHSDLLSLVYEQSSTLCNLQDREQFG